MFVPLPVMETKVRSIAKAISYRVLGSTSTAAIVFLFSHKLSLSLGVGLIDSVVKIAMYFLHERIWNYIDFGRPKPPEYEI
jgi:adenylylsulfate kinase